MRFTPAFILSFLIFTSSNVSAQDSSRFDFSAYLDLYYAYDISRPFDNQRFVVAQYDRHNEFNLNHGILKGTYSGTKTRASLGLHTGTYVTNNYSGEPNDFTRMIFEAYGGIKTGSNSWLDIGIFGGHFGYESALAIERELYSPSLGTEYTPYYQTGVRWSTKLSEQTSLRVVVLNGWQNIAETNSDKSFGFALDHEINEQISVSYGNYFGNEAPDEFDSRVRFHNNLIFTIKPTDGLSIAAIGDFTSQQLINSDVETQALFVTLIASTQLQHDLSLAARYEYVKDENGLLISGRIESFEANIISTALTYQPQPNVSVKFEPKLYLGSENLFSGEDGVGQDAWVFSLGLMAKIQ